MSTETPQNEDNSVEFLTKRELAGRLKRSTRWVEQRVALGQIPVIRMGARSALFEWKSVIRKIRQFEVNGVAKEDNFR